MEYNRLIEVAELFDSLHQTPQYISSGYPMIRVADVSAGNLQLEMCLKVSFDDYQKYTAKHTPKIGDIVISRVGTYGIFAYVNTKKKFCLGQNTAIISPKINSKYLYYCLSSSIVKEQINSLVVGSTQKTISLKNIKALNIPRYGEQNETKIASILSVIDEKREINKRINENLLQQARALFHQWVTGTLPALLKLSDVADINPETYSSKDNWSFVNYLDTSSITAGTISEVQYILPSEEKLPSRARRILRKGDVVFSTVRPNQLHYGIIANPKPNMLGSTGFAVIRSKLTALPNEIIFLALTEPDFVEHMQQLAEQSVSTFPSIRPTDLDACLLPEPREDDGDFIEAIKTIFNTVATNDEENQRLAALRDTLLPRLMSGELDVSDLDL